MYIMTMKYVMALMPVFDERDVQDDSDVCDICTVYIIDDCDCSELSEVGVVMSSKEGAQLNWGNRWAQAKGMGRGSQFTSNLGPGWTRIAPHRKEGFQVSKRD